MGALAAVVLLALIAYKVVRQATPAIHQFGFGFLADNLWDPIKGSYGALTFIGGTVISAFLAVLIATPLAVAIALFLTELSPRRLAGPIATLVELLAAIPSVVLGLWGILVLGPWLAEHPEPWLHDHLGFIPFFAGSPSQAGMLPAVLILTIMIVPIVASLCRELFSRIPRDLQHASLALGSTRWEMVRGVILPYAGPGIAAAVLLGLGRAFGEAIAVTQVIGSGNAVHLAIFEPGGGLGDRPLDHLGVSGRLGLRQPA